MPIIFELQVGQVDRGADVSSLSQYPGEAEITLPPLSNIEVVDEPRVSRVKGKDVLVIPAKINVNLKTLSREQLVSLRHSLLLDALRNIVHEITQELKRRLDDLVRRKRLGRDSLFARNGRTVVKMIVEGERTDGGRLLRHATSLLRRRARSLVRRA